MERRGSTERVGGLARRAAARAARAAERLAAPPDAVAHAAPDDLVVRTVEVRDAVLTPFRKGPVASDRPPRFWMSGAVHRPDGRLVPESQRLWAGDPLALPATDPRMCRVPAQARRLEGTWLYAGHWHPHFGHFFLETLTTLWPERFAVAGIVGHRNYRGDVPPPRQGVGLTDAVLKPWQVDLLDLAGWGGLPVKVVRNWPVRVDRLVVPSRTLVLKTWAAPEAVALWRRVAAGVAPAGPAKTFFSRRAFHAEHAGDHRRVRTDEQWERDVEEAFAAAGFEVVSPETLPLREQLARVRAADVLAGTSGSALHLAAFAEPATTVVEVGDLRSGERPAAAQRMVDVACGHHSRYVPYGDRRALRAAARAAASTRRTW